MVCEKQRYWRYKNISIILLSLKHKYFFRIAFLHNMFTSVSLKVLHLMIRLLINIYNANLQFLEPYVLNRTPNKHRIVVIFSYQKYFFILQGIYKWWWSTFLCNWRKIPEVLYFVVYFMVEKISLYLGLYGFTFYFIESIQWGQCCEFVKRGDRYRLGICKKKTYQTQWIYTCNYLLLLPLLCQNCDCRLDWFNLRQFVILL